MKKLSLLTLGAMALMLAAPLSAGAQSDNRDVVKDERSNVVKNTFGNCVRTKWLNDRDDCGAAGGVTLNKEMLTIYFGFDSAQLTRRR